jgi:RNA 2',3'-cyclic 3'-phosphodiesterase
MRLFVAIDIPDEVRASLAGLVAKLRPACRSARWVRIEGIHVTLKFIGETPPEKVGAIRAALSAVPERPPAPIVFRGLGYFPNERRPRVLWAGVEGGSELAQLASEVDAALHPLGIVREERTYSPHLTLARFDEPRGLDTLHTAIAKAGPLEFGATTATEFHLYQSILKPGGAEYTRVATFSFAETIAGRKPE